MYSIHCPRDCILCRNASPKEGGVWCRNESTHSSDGEDYGNGFWTFYCSGLKKKPASSTWTCPRCVATERKAEQPSTRASLTALEAEQSLNQPLPANWDHCPKSCQLCQDAVKAKQGVRCWDIGTHLAERLADHNRTEYGIDNDRWNLECAGLKVLPGRHEKWACPRCRARESCVDRALSHPADVSRSPTQNQLD